MKREESLLFVGKIVKYYGDKITIKQEQFDIWYECLKDLRLDVCEKAFTEYVKDSKFPPTVADIREKYNEVWGRYKSMIRSINDSFDLASGSYPCITDEQRSAGLKIFAEIVNRYPNDRKERAAANLAQAIMDHVKEVERGTDRTIEPFDKYMEQMRNEFTG